MELLMAILIGVLFAGGTYMILRRSLIKLIIGLILLGHGANFLIFTVGDISRAQPPLVPAGDLTPLIPFADPLPQALVLTAIVIGFGLQAFALVLVRRVYETLGTDDLDQMKATE